MQPGETIGPNGSSSESPAPVGSQQGEVAGDMSNSAQPPTPNTSLPEVPQAATGDQALAWTASEYIEHQKPSGWYMAVVAVGFVLATILYLITKDIISVVVAILATGMFAVVGSQKPQTQEYKITNRGIVIGSKSYSFEEFKSFALLEEGVVDLVQLFPLKKFVAPVSMYFPPDMANQIVDTLADFLPVEEKDHEMVDRLMKRIKF